MILIQPEETVYRLKISAFPLKNVSPMSLDLRFTVRFTQ